MFTRGDSDQGRDVREASVASAAATYSGSVNDRPILLVSPHLDDVVLSAWAVLARPHPIDVLTVFSGAPAEVMATEWDRLCGFSDSHDAMTSRRLEDDAAFDGLPHQRHFLGLLDGQYRSGPRGPEDETALVVFVRDWLDSHAGGLVLAPIGAGRRHIEPTLSGRVRLKWNGAERKVRRRVQTMRGVPRPRIGPPANPDHLWVRDLVMAGGWRAAVGYYEEIPYQWGAPGDATAHWISSALRATRVSVDPQAKAERIAAYASQVPHLVDLEPPLSDAAAVPNVERYWLPNKNDVL